MRPLIRAAAAAATLLVARAPSPLAAQGQPYGRDDVLLLVQGGVTGPRVATLIGSDCISFRMDADAVQALTRAGADGQALAALRALCYAPPILRFQTATGELPLDPASIEPHTLIFLVRSGTRPVATAAEVIARQVYGTQNVFAVEQAVTGPNLSLKYELIFDRRTYAPIRMVYDRTAGSHRTRLGLERNGDRMVGPVSGFLGLPRNVSLPAPRGTILPGMHEMLIAAADLSAQREFTVQSFDYRARPCSLTVAVRGERSVTVRVGTFDAYELDISGCDEEQHTFVRRSAPHLILRQEFPNGTSVELIEVRPGNDSSRREKPGAGPE